MTTTHKLLVTISCGDPDLGAEVEAMVTFTYLKGAPERGPSYANGGQPSDPDEIEFVSAEHYCNGKPSPFHGGFSADEQKWLDDVAEAWLDTDEGHHEALGVAVDDDMCAQDDAADMQAEMRKDDR